MQRIRPTSLTAAILFSLSLAGSVIAQSSAPTPAQTKELEAARAELDRAADRYAELARKFHGSEAETIRIERGLMRKPVIGVLLASDDRKGVRIAGVTPEGPAAEAGIRSGDRLLKVDGMDILGSSGELRVENARTLLAHKSTQTPVQLTYERDGRQHTVSATPRISPQAIFLGGDTSFRMLEDLDIDIDHEDIRKRVDQAMQTVSTEMPRINREIVRIFDCKDGDGDCAFPALTEAFRWSGLNLASLDPELGRYFGTDQGVLVLSTDGELDGLQAGDVVQKIDGKPVGSPREAMAALRAKPAESRVRVDYLRDRKPVTAQVSVPKATPFRIPPAPPVPPTPPTPPTPPSASRAPAPPAAPTPPAAPQVVEKRKIVIVDKNGNSRTWRAMPTRLAGVGEDLPVPPPPPAPPAPPPASD